MSISGKNTLTDETPSYADRASTWGDTHVPGGARVLWIGGGLILVGLLVWYLVHSQTAVQTGGRFGQGGPMPVGVARAVAGTMPITLDALGTVTPLATVTVRPQVSGNIVKFDFQEGQLVKAGDVLAEIDPRPFQAALDQAKGVLDKDKAALANAIIDEQRYQKLLSLKAISDQIYATQVALVAQDKGTVKSDEGTVETAALNLSYTKVTSPVAGRVGIRQVDVGNLVQAGQTNGIVVVTQIQPMSVVFSVPEDNIDQVTTRMNSGATLTAEAYDRGQTQKLASGTLSAVDSEIDTTTGTVKMRAMFDNTDNALFPQQFVNIRLLVDTLQDQTLVPAAAVQRGSQGAFVYVVAPDKTVAMRTVTLGATDGTNVAITQGLKPGDTVVIDGADRLRDGSEVTIPNSTAKIAAPSAGGASASGDARAARFQRMLSHLPADQRAALEKMTPEQRHAWFQAHRGQFHHGGGGGGGGP
ncbi:MAG TPA: MdtA/MuxA family multidrug efflux RND transporter periplasmic adaptor subunit [Rhizomicrobium sp.]|nr:MdtA/MuxA family multidrug efflux RND transporter periplasmic adaptor subunit [Rhizomicrobium sp.]